MSPTDVNLGRDPRLDMFRGLALVMIFINHVPGTIYEHFTSRNFGFSDAAEGFVLMSGIAAGLAYGRRFGTGSFREAAMRVWARAALIYRVHIAITLVAFAFAIGAALAFDLPQVIWKTRFGALFTTPVQAIVGLPTLGYQLDYFNILPLYCVLLAVTPFILWAALRWPRGVLIASIALWAIAGQFRLNLPNLPGPGGWFLDPFSWQLIFVIGLLAGLGMKRGVPFVPYRPWLFAAAVAFVVFILFWTQIDALAIAGRDVLGIISRAGAPHYITWFDKAYLPLPRLLHALALAYVLASLPVVRTIATTRFAEPLKLLGRHSLPVFAAGSLLSLVFRIAKTGTPGFWVTDGAMLAAGLLMLWLLAYVLEERPDLVPATAAIRDRGRA